MNLFKDYPAMNEVAAELKWDLRSQIHPTVTQTASEPQTVSTIDFFCKIAKKTETEIFAFYGANLDTDNEAYMFEHTYS